METYNVNDGLKLLNSQGITLTDYEETFFRKFWPHWCDACDSLLSMVLTLYADVLPFDNLREEPALVDQAYCAQYWRRELVESMVPDFVADRFKRGDPLDKILRHAFNTKNHL